MYGRTCLLPIELSFRKDEMKKIKKEKPRTLTFEIPSSVPQLDNNILQAWLQMVEY